MRLEGWMGLIKPGDLKVRRRAVLTILIGWVPLVVFTGLHDLTLGGNSLRSLLLDFGSYARYLVAAPLFVFAESACFTAFERIILHFRDSGLIADGDRQHYEDIVRSSSRLLRSKVAEVMSFLIAYVLAVWAVLVLPPNALISWSFVSMEGAATLSLAGKWHAFVSVPLLIVLILGWIWRQLSWARFLLLVSRMNLQLIPTHPDQCGGLKFLSTITNGYRQIGFAFTAIAAGGIANRIVHSGAPLQRYSDVMIGLVLFSAGFLLAPLAVFSSSLRRMHTTAVFQYGSLAANLGCLLDRKWLDFRNRLLPETLRVPDFSATTDLYSIVANVYKIGHVPISWRSIRELLIFLILPFVPVLFMAMPLKTVLKTLVKLALS